MTPSISVAVNKVYTSNSGSIGSNIRKFDAFATSAGTTWTVNIYSYTNGLVGYYAPAAATALAVTSCVY